MRVLKNRKATNFEEKFGRLNFSFYLCNPNRKRGKAKVLTNNFFSQNFEKKFCRLKNCCYLCNPNRKRTGFGHQPDRLVFFSAKFERSLTRLLGKYKQVPRNKKIIESVNSFGIKGVRFKLRNKEYTKKSLILAQDER